MTKRKTDLADDLAERVEREAVAWVKAAPTEHWINMVRPWSRWLPELSPTAQRRILVTMLEETVARGDKQWPPELIGYFARQAIPHLKVSEQPRSRIHNNEAFREAAKYWARHPDMSLRRLARKFDVGQSTMRQWARMPDFARYGADA